MNHAGRCSAQDGYVRRINQSPMHARSRMTTDDSPRRGQLAGGADHQCPAAPRPHHAPPLRTKGGQTGRTVTTHIHTYMHSRVTHSRGLTCVGHAFSSPHVHVRGPARRAVCWPSPAPAAKTRQNRRRSRLLHALSNSGTFEKCHTFFFEKEAGLELAGDYAWCKRHEKKMSMNNARRFNPPPSP